MGWYHRKKDKTIENEYHPWKITEKEFSVEDNHHYESIFALGNGYMGLRGTLEEDYSGPVNTTTSGVYINGVYTAEPIFYGEEAPDQPELSQTMVNLTDWTGINLYLEGEKFDMLRGEVTHYRRTLDLKQGTLERRLIWESPEGRKIALKITRIISLTHKHIGVINYSFTPLNFDCRAHLIVSLEGERHNSHHLRDKKPLTVVSKGFEDKRGYILHKIESTGIVVGSIMDNKLHISDTTPVKRFNLTEDNRVIEQFVLEVEQKQEYTLTKYVALADSLDIGNLGKTQEDIQDDIRENIEKENRELAWQEIEQRLQEKTFDIIKRSIERATKRGWEHLLQAQEKYLKGYWNEVDIGIIGDPALQQAFHFNAFHLLQSTGKNGKTSVPAKGLSGEFYEGHYFWDTEIYVLPFFIYNRPEIARRLLLYRYHTLDQARDNARRIKLDGALYPWRTINGEEASGFFMGSTVQYHIDADIAYAVYLYAKTTRDLEFLYNFGAEILIETARMWASRGSYISLLGDQFCFNEVCGPDEYKPGVSNNCYNNYMAKFNLEYALEVIELMDREVPEKLAELKERLNLDDEELKEWDRAARNIFLPFNEELGIHPQDDSFLYKDPIDLNTIPEEDFPLVNNWHPLIIWRYQVIKQADVILLMLLHGDKFTLEEKKANYDYYEPKTTHDSSLSPAIHSIIANEIGYYKEAYDYFMQTARLDLDDYHNNSYKGVHAACMAGSWMALVMGFGGMRNYNGNLSFNPVVPEAWDGYQFTIRFQGRLIRVKVEKDRVSYRLLQGEKLDFIHRNRELTLTGEGIVVEVD